MNKGRVGVVILLLVLAASAELVTLTDADFDSKDLSGVWYIKFYAPWCGHCKHMAPAWEQLANLNLPGAHIAQVDCTDNRRACSKFGIRGFPTLLLLAEDKNVYQFALGDRTNLTLHKSFLVDHKNSPVYMSNPLSLRPARPMNDDAADVAPTRLQQADVGVTHFTSRNIAPTLAGNDERWLVFAVARWCGHCQALEPTIQKLGAIKSKAFHVARIECDDETVLCSTLGVRGFPHIFLAMNGQQVKYSSADRSEEALTEFAAQSDSVFAQNATPLSFPPPRARLPKLPGSSVSLDDETFDVETMDNAWLIAFIDGTCGNDCDIVVNAVFPVVAAERPSPQRYAVVNCDSSPLTCREFNITTAPQVRLVYRDRSFTFQREAGALIHVQQLLDFLDDKYRVSVQSPRMHIRNKRRLTFSTVDTWVAWEDMVRQYRYVLLIAVLMGFMVVGLFVGSGCANGRTRQHVDKYYVTKPKDSQSHKKPAPAAAGQSKKGNNNNNNNNKAKGE